MSPNIYVQEAHYTVHLAANIVGKYKISKKAENLFKMGYDPGLDTSPEIDPDAASYYLMIISILRRIIELGRISIITEVLLFLFFVELPREGHLEVALHVMAHGCQRWNSRLMYDPS